MEERFKGEILMSGIGVHMMESQVVRTIEVNNAAMVN
jgi:hypothetical protein